MIFMQGRQKSVIQQQATKRPFKPWIQFLCASIISILLLLAVVSIPLPSASAHQAHDGQNRQVTSTSSLTSLSPQTKTQLRQKLKQAITVKRSQKTTTPTTHATPKSATSLTLSPQVVSMPAYNNVGTSDDSNTIAGNLDGGGYSYSAEALQGAGLIPGQNFTFNGITYVWPNAAAGTNNNYAAQGQIIPVTPAVPDAAELGFLGASTGQDASGTATITFTDNSTQTFTLGMTNWWASTPSFGNTIAASLPYLNTATGKYTRTVVLFSAQVSIPAGKTVQSVTLPSSSTPGQLHIFAVGVSGPTYNNTGTSDDSNPTAANLDGAGRSYSAQALQAAHITPGVPVISDGISYTWPSPASGSPNNDQAAGQTLPVVPVANATTLGFLGASTNGNTSGTATVTYTDTTTSTFTLGLSDWYNCSPTFGNATVATLSYFNMASGKQTRNICLYNAEFSIPAGKTVQSVTLPATVSPGQLHVFAIGTRAAYNNIGMSDDSNTIAGSLDGAGRSYSVQALQAAHMLPGQPLVRDGISYTFPQPGPGAPNNYVAAGQTLPVTSVPNATTLGFLGASTVGSSSGTATITYTDTTTSTITLGLTDWYTCSALTFSNSIAVTLPYINTYTGQQTWDNCLYTAEFPIPSGKTVQSVTLPTTTSPGQLHIFAIGTRTAANNIGISDDSAPLSANFDGGGVSYSAQSFSDPSTGMGWNPGDTLTYNGMNFTWPNVPSGQADNYATNGQTITLPVTPVANANTLGIVGASSGGEAQGTATITYTDNSTQTFTLDFSDWTLKAETVAPVASDHLFALLDHRNTPQGPQQVDTYLFYTDVAVNAAKTIKSLTLPTSTTGSGTLHVFMLGTRAGSAYMNNIGISDDTATTFANFDGQGNSYSLQALKTAAHLNPDQDFFFNGMDFPWTNSYSVVPDNYETASSYTTYATVGQTMPVTPVANANTLAFIGAASNGSSTGTATITFTDNSTQTFTLNFPDWTVSPANSPYSNVNLVASMSYYNKPSGRGSGYTMYLYEMETSIPTNKTVQSVTLPTAPTGGQLHVFALGTRAGAYNNVGTSDDATPYYGNFDGGQKSYSAQGLQSVGLAPGQSFTTNGATFTWPSPAAGYDNNYQAAGQVISVTPLANATTLSFLGAATNGSSSGTATITYTDNSTQTFTLGFADWCTSSISSLPYGNSVAVTMPYRNLPTGKQTVNTYVFSTSVTITAGKTIQSVTLPATVSGGALHVFAISTK